MVIKQLNPPIPQYCLGDNFFPSGMCLAHFLIDYSVEYNLYWVCCMDEGGVWFTIPNQLIRGQNNRTYGRNREAIV
jgi:hypothetical protein